MPVSTVEIQPAEIGHIISRIAGDHVDSKGRERYVGDIGLFQAAG